jgi:hypothetical protein
MLLITQTPDHYRESIAEFLGVVQSDLATGSPLDLLLTEVITEVQHDPYTELPQTPADAHDFTW